MLLCLLTRPPSSSVAQRCRQAIASRRRNLTADHSIYVSRSTNPYFNLSLEDWLFRNKPHQEPLLLLYRNAPCIVIGRNQNPWKEINLERASLRAVSFLRRRSGGGTVFHDLGNTNYSIHVPRSSFDRKETAELVVRAVRSLGVPAGVNERNDICAGGFKICSAYKIANKRAYHHGTMLISTDLTTLGDMLHTTKETMVTKGVASVRSPVRNLRDFGAPAVTHDDFVDAVANAFRSKYELPEEDIQIVGNEEDAELLQEGMQELKSWEWQFGQTPEFQYSISELFEWGRVDAEINAKHGVILNCSIACHSSSDSSNVIDRADLQRMEQLLRGEKYGFLADLSSAFASASADSGCSEEVTVRCNEVLSWLVRATRT